MVSGMPRDFKAGGLVRDGTYYEGIACAHRVSVADSR